MEASEILKQFNDIWEFRHEYAKDWKRRTGGKVVGFMCTYTPEELLYAADILPVRILGGHEPPSLATPHMFDMWCSFSRDCLSQALKGRYEYLDGLLETNTCLHMRQAFGAWEIHVPTPWIYYFDRPPSLFFFQILFRQAIDEPVSFIGRLACIEIDIQLMLLKPPVDVLDRLFYVEHPRCPLAVRLHLRKRFIPSTELRVRRRIPGLLQDSHDLQQFRHPRSRYRRKSGCCWEKHHSIPYGR